MNTHKSDVHGRYFVTPVQILERFMLMGSMGATYSTNDKFAEFSKEVITSVKAIVENFPAESIAEISSVVTLNKAPRKPPVLLVLAAAMSVEATRTQAEELAKKYVFTGTDQFVLTKFLLDLGRGQGRSFKRQASLLYSKLDKLGTSFGRDMLALNMVKYRNRAGWTHRDLLRVSHFKPSEMNNDLFKWVVGKGPAKHDLLRAYEAASSITDPAKAVHLIQEFPKVPWEAFQTEILGSRDVWENLLPNLGDSAIIRNLGRLSSLGIDLSSYEGKILEACRNLHPVASLSAWRVYTKGQGIKGSLSWTPNARIGDVLEHGFSESFGQLKKSESKVLFGIDVSGSMGMHPSTVPGLNCREVAAAMVMVAMRQQPYMAYGFSHTLVPLDIQDNWSLNQVMQYMARITFGATNCALPIRFASEHSISDVDLFAIYTDNETNQRDKPSHALNYYRAMHNPNAKLATVALMGGAFSIADPNDPGQVDFIGFDPTVPSVMVSLAEQKLV